MSEEKVKYLVGVVVRWSYEYGLALSDVKELVSDLAEVVLELKPVAEVL